LAKIWTQYLWWTLIPYWMNWSTSQISYRPMKWARQYTIFSTSGALSSETLECCNISRCPLQIVVFKLPSFFVCWVC
jgi:hypothetical protein